MWELDHKEHCALKNCCFLTCGAGKDSWESLGLQEIKPVNPEGNKPWILGKINAEAKVPILWHLMQRTKSLEKTLMLRKINASENKMVKQHHWLNGHEFEQSLRDNEGWRRLACWSPWGHKELDMTQQLNSNNVIDMQTVLVNSFKVVGKEKWERGELFCAPSHLLCRIFRTLIFLSFASTTPVPHCDYFIQSMNCFFRLFLKSPMKNIEWAREKLCFTYSKNLNAPFQVAKSPSLHPWTHLRGYFMTNLK